jgi:hypothetical protein
LPDFIAKAGEMACAGWDDAPVTISRYSSADEISQFLAG